MYKCVGNNKYCTNYEKGYCSYNGACPSHIRVGEMEKWLSKEPVITLDKDSINNGIDVTVLFYKGFVQKVFHNVINMYEKDGFFCMRTEKRILKIPMIHILYVSHEHTDYIGTGGNI